MMFIKAIMQKSVLPLALGAFVFGGWMQAVAQNSYPQQQTYPPQTYPQQYPNQQQSPASTYPQQQQYPNQSPGQYPNQQQYPYQAYPQQPYGSPVAQGQYGQVMSGTVLPAGTLMTLAPDQPIQRAQAGSSYPARITQNVMGANGQVLIPAGSPAQLTVINAVSPAGQSELALALQAVTVNGRTYNVASTSAQTSASSQRTTTSANSLSPSMGGLLGTLVQVIGAHGGQTAVAGATQSAAGSNWGGVLGQILTHGSMVSVPSQSQLTFRLDQPLVLQ